MSNVLIVDDHAITRCGYRELLADEPLVATIGEASNVEEAIRELASHHWDLMLVDVQLPGRSGISLLEHVRAHHPNTRVLIVSGLPEEQYALGVIRAGALGYVSKTSTANELLKAVRLAMNRRHYLSPGLAQTMAEDIGTAYTPGSARHDHLSRREMQVFRKLAAGRRPSDIASELQLSVKTVSTYRSRIIKKMHLSSNAEMTRYAYRNGLSDPDQANTGERMLRSDDDAHV